MDGTVLISGVILGQQLQRHREDLHTLHLTEEGAQFQQRPSAADLLTMVLALHRPVLNMTLLHAP
eukprot:602741-Karenia_brevis.AAC.1